MTTDILSFVLARLRDPETNLATVVSETGLKRSWLWQLKDGRIPDPSVRKIQQLADYFAAKGEGSPPTSPRPAFGPGAKSDMPPVEPATAASLSAASVAGVPRTGADPACMQGAA